MIICEEAEIRVVELVVVGQASNVLDASHESTAA